MGSQWIKNTIRGVLISAADSIGGDHDPQNTTEITGTDLGNSKRGIDSVIYNPSDLLTSRFTITTQAAAYTAGDFIAKVELTNFFDRDNGNAVLESIHMLCKDKVSSQFEIRVFKDEPTIASATNAVYDITDSECEKEIGCFTVQVGTRFLSASNYSFFKNHLNMPVTNADASAPKSLWIAVITQANVTFTSTSGLSILGARRQL